MITRFLCLLLMLFPLAAQASQVLWGSARLATNYLSSGAPATLNSDFTFQLGAFVDGFVPTADNTADWLDHWVPAQSTGYNEQTHFFTGSYVYQESSSPFLPSNQGYIFGFNRWAASEGGHQAEWILATDSAWKWPSGSSISPPVQWSMSSASNVILGTVGDSSSSFHMMTAEVPAPLPSFTAELWMKRYIGSTDDIAGLMADPDHDGLSNQMEFFLSTNPLKPDHGRYTKTELLWENDAFHVQLTFFKLGLAPEVTLGVEVSSDLHQWEPAGDTFEVMEDSLLIYRARATEPVQARAGGRFYRLVATSSP